MQQVPSERRRVTVDGIPVVFDVAGAGSPLILLHGLSGSSRWWSRNVGPLAQDFQVYTIDLVGFGRSKSRHRFTLGAAAGLIAAWMECEGLARASIAGHSMGGLIAADLAAEAPGVVDRLILVSAALLPPNTRVLRQAPGLLHAVRRLPLSFLPVLAADALRAGSLTIWGAVRELLSLDLRPKLGDISAQTLLIWGDRDTLTPLTTAHELQRRIAGAELVVLEGAGHVPMWDRPEAFNNAVRSFLAVR